MGTVQIITYAIECDGCNNVFGAPHGLPSSMDVRAAAYAEGWRFPALTGKNDESRQISSDVCPTCLPSWVAQEKRIPQRRATDAEVRAWADTAHQHPTTTPETQR